MSGAKSLERAETGPMTAAEAAIWRSRPDPLSFRRLNRPLSPGNAGASRRKPKPARPCTMARAETAVAASAEPETSLLFSTESYQNALDRLRRAFADGLPLAVLVGDDKAGESFIIQNFLAAIEDDGAVARITELGPDAVAGMREIVQALGLDSDSEDVVDLEDVFVDAEDAR